MPLPFLDLQMLRESLRWLCSVITVLLQLCADVLSIISPLNRCSNRVKSVCLQTASATPVPVPGRVPTRLGLSGTVPVCTCHLDMIIKCSALRGGG